MTQDKLRSSGRDAALRIARTVGGLFGAPAADRAIEQTLRDLRANCRFVKHYSRGLTPRANSHRFIILGLMRSGSTLLGDLLQRHPDVSWLGEQYIQQAYCPTLYLRGITNAAPTSCVGVKIFSFEFGSQLQVPAMSFDRSEVKRARQKLERLRDSGWKFIHLERRDVFSQSVSFTRAMQSGTWHQTAVSARQSHPMVKLDLREFEQHLSSFLTFRRFEREILPGFDMLRLVYESDLLAPESRDRSVARAFAHLGLSPVAVSSDYVKIDGRPLDRQVENYSEIATIAERLAVSPSR